MRASPTAKIARSKRVRFPLTTEECELLCTFKNTDGLQELAAALAKDVTVVSRNLKSLAEKAPLLFKKSGRWQLTDLGFTIARWAESSAHELTELIKIPSRSLLNSNSTDSVSIPDCLLVIGAQLGFLELPSPYFPDNTIENIEKIISFFRNCEKEIIFVNLISNKDSSPFFPGSKGTKAIPKLSPKKHERVLTRSFNDPFHKSTLHEELGDKSISSLAVCGFSLNHCVDATARRASDLGFKVIVITDAAGCYERRNQRGQTIPAAEVSFAIIANLQTEYAITLSTNEFLGIKE